MKSSYHMKRKAADRLWKLAYQKRYDDTEPLLAEGTKVKLDVDKILSTKQRRHLSQKYIDFVNTHTKMMCSQSNMKAGLETNQA